MRISKEEFQELIELEKMIYSIYGEAIKRDHARDYVKFYDSIFNSRKARIIQSDLIKFFYEAHEISSIKRAVAFIADNEIRFNVDRFKAIKFRQAKNRNFLVIKYLK